MWGDVGRGGANDDVREMEGSVMSSPCYDDVSAVGGAVVVLVLWKGVAGGSVMWKGGVPPLSSPFRLSGMDVLFTCADVAR